MRVRLRVLLREGAQFRASEHVERATTILVRGLMWDRLRAPVTRRVLGLGLR